jgi:hypothetical protein
MYKTNSEEMPQRVFQRKAARNTGNSAACETAMRKIRNAKSEGKCIKGKQKKTKTGHFEKNCCAVTAPQ